MLGSRVCLWSSHDRHVYGAPIVDQNLLHVVVGHYGLDDQCITMWVTDMAGVHFTKGDAVRLTSELFGRALVGRARGQNRPFPGFSEVAVLGSPCFSSKVWFTEDSSDHTRRFCLLLVLVGLGAPVADVVLECDAFLNGVANVSVISTVFILVSL